MKVSRPLLSATYLFIAPGLLAALACSSSPGDGSRGVTGGSPGNGGSGGATLTGGSPGVGGTGAAPATGGISSGGSSAGGSTSSGGGVAQTGGASSGGQGAATGSGGAGGIASGSSGGAASGGSADGGTAGSGGSEPTGPTSGKCTVGAGVPMGEGSTQERYLDADVQRDAQNYMMITNGWGQNWRSHDISWLGTEVTVNAFEGSRQSNGAPAGYPSVFCGRYSNKNSGECGLPAARASLTQVNTAASWSHPDANGVYNVAYDVWMGSAAGGGLAGGLQSYFMVWLHDPAEEGPAGSLKEQGIAVEGAEGVWNLVTGTVNGLPIVNYVRAEGDDVHDIAFDLMDFIRDAETRNLTFPGDDILAVAIGFEIWQGSVTNLKLNDFCVDVQ